VALITFGIGADLGIAGGSLGLVIGLVWICLGLLGAFGVIEENGEEKVANLGD
jgi:hypothetical protein